MREPDVIREPIDGRRAEVLRFRDAGVELTWDDCLRGWRDDPAFRDRFGAALAGSAFAALRWECPPLTLGALPQPFECVLIEAPELQRPADSGDFAEHLTAASPVVRFANLGGDAELVVPRPVAGSAAYPHLAAFLRHAPAAQRDALWRTVADAVDAMIGTTPLWLNTAGDGVPWLHVRLDRQPKYYRHAPYCALREA